MMDSGAWVGALLLAAQPLVGPPPASGQAVEVAPTAFAPPVDRPMTYRVTSRRPLRDGSFASFTQVYDIRWQRAEQGYLLTAHLDRIESDARPDLARMLSAMLQPLVGETMTYTVSADGSHLALADADRLWQRVLARVEAAAAAADRPEARQAAQLIGNLSPQERDRLAIADIQAMLAAGGASFAAGQSARSVVTRDGTLGTITWTETQEIPGRAPLQVDVSRTVDVTTGLLINERRRTLLAGSDGGAPVLAEEKIRTLAAAPNL